MEPLPIRAVDVEGRSGIRSLFGRNGLSIRSRLIACFLVMVLLMVVADVVSVWQYRQIEALARLESKTDQVSLALTRVHLDVYRLRDWMAALASRPDLRRFRSEAASNRQTFLQHVNDAERALRTTPELAWKTQMPEALDRLRGTMLSQVDTAVELASLGEWNAIQLQATGANQAQIELSSSLVERVDQEAQQERSGSIEDAQQASQRFFVIVPVAALLTLLAAAALGWYVTRTVTGPLLALTARAQALARGDFERRVYFHANHELDVLGNAFNYAAEQLQRLYGDIRQREGELRGVINAVPAYVWSAQPDGTVDFINDRLLNFTGLSSSQMLGWNWESVLHPEDREQFVAGWREAVQNGRSMETEVRVRRADGQYRWHYVSGVPLRSDKGEILKWYGGGFEIEDRKRAEALLARENHILEMVATGESLSEILNALCFVVEEYAEGAVASILLVEGDRVHLGASPSLPKDFNAAMEGAPLGTFAGSSGSTAYPRRQVMVEDIASDPLWTNYRNLALAYSLRACWSTPIFSSHGDVIATFAMYYRERATPDRSQQEMIRQIAQVAGIAIERKLTQDALRSSEAYLTEAQRVARLGTWVSSVPDRQIVYVSDEWYRIYGFDPAQGLTNLKRRLARIHPEDREQYTGAVERALAEGSDFDVEFRIVLPNGSMKYVHMAGRPVRNESSRLVSFLGIVGDITERRQAEMALRAAMEERMRLTAFREEIGTALSRPEDLKHILHGCAGAVVRHLDAVFARIWILNTERQELELQASAGMYTHLDGAHSRIPVGQFKIGLIAQEKRPIFTDDAQNDPRVSDRDWARRENLISFAGYPLILEDRVVGVMGMFARKPLSESTLEALSYAAGIIAQGIERKRAEEALRQSEEYLAEGQRLTHVGSWSLNVISHQALHSSAEHTRLFGYDPDKGTPQFGEFLQRVHPEDQERVVGTFQALTQSGGDMDLHYRVVMPGGSVRHMHAIGHPVFKPGEDPGEYVGITVYITERKRSD